MKPFDYSKVIVNDDRTEEETTIYTHLVVGKDSFLSDWGMAEGGISIAAWACTPDMVDNVMDWIKDRSDIYAIKVLTEPLSVAEICREMSSFTKTKHISIYKVTEGHRYSRPYKEGL